MRIPVLILFVISMLWLPCNTLAGDTEKFIENSIGMRLVLVPAGEYIMGSSFTDPDRQPDEYPHKVTFTHDFYMSEAEVTQSQWEAVMGFNRSHHKGPALPVEKISWKDAVTFCEKLSTREGKTFRLPTEAEWEYACKAGGNDSDIRESAWYFRNSHDSTHAVKQKTPNAWGFYDMLGNVSEWCQDYYQREYPDSDVTDPTGPDQGKTKVIRGGAFDSFPPALRCAARTQAPASYQYIQTGFRIVLIP